MCLAGLLPECSFGSQFQFSLKSMDSVEHLTRGSATTGNMAAKQLLNFGSSKSTFHNRMLFFFPLLIRISNN